MAIFELGIFDFRIRDFRLEIFLEGTVGIGSEDAVFKNEVLAITQRLRTGDAATAVRRRNIDLL